MTEIVSFGEWVQARRNQLRYTRKGFADLVGCAPITIKKIERDERKPSAEIGELLATHLQIPQSEKEAFLRRARGEFVARLSSPEEMPLVEAQTVIDPRSSNHNLPIQLTEYILHKHKLEKIEQLISDNRLVTLTGIGGIGKTTLSVQAGWGHMDAFKDGVWLIELAPVSDPSSVLRAVADTFNLQAASQITIEDVLLTYLAEKNCLLILDNCEHVIEAVSKLIETILQTCPNVKILTSSRETLSLQGEVSFDVPVLTIPKASEKISLSNWSEYEAIRLFMTRATAVLPQFKVTAENIRPIASICQQLDGVPFAIELAAARVKLLSTAQINDRLSRRFKLLTSGRRTALPRHQSLSALIDWSWELLTPDEQKLLQRLSVFSGGMHLEAVELICSDSTIDKDDILGLLGELANKSLIVAKREPQRTTRYYLLETIRQYAQSKLAIAGKAYLFQQRHLDYYCTLAETAEPALYSSEQASWSKQLDEELDNLRAALTWANVNDIPSGLALVSRLHRFWFMKHIDEGDNWLDQLIGQSSHVAPTIQAKALSTSANIKTQLLQQKDALPLINKAFALYQDIDDESGIARAQMILGAAQFGLGQTQQSMEQLHGSVIQFRREENLHYGAESLFVLGFLTSVMTHSIEAMDYFYESEQICRDTGDSWLLVEVLCRMAQNAIFREDYAVAGEKLDECATIQKELSLEENNRTYMFIRGVYHFFVGEFEEAEPYLKSGFALNQQYGDLFNGYWTLVFLGYLSIEKGDLSNARQYLNDAIILLPRTEIGQLWNLESSVEGFAKLAMKQLEFTKATRIYGWAITFRSNHQTFLPPAEQALIDQDIATIKGVIDEESFKIAFNEGSAMTIEQIVAYATEES